MLALGDNRRKVDRYKPEEMNYRLPDYVRPIHYNIELLANLLCDNFTLDGITRIDFEIRRSTFDLILHCDGIVIDESITELTNSRNERLVPIEHDYVAEKEFLLLRFGFTLKPARYTLLLKFNEDPKYFTKKNSTDKRDNTMSNAQLTNFQTTLRPIFFPCFDEPTMKATFSISINHPANYVALSNETVEERPQIDEKGNVLTRFRTTPIMSTYSLAVLLLPDSYIRVSNHDGTVNVWCRKNSPNMIKLIQSVTKEAKIHLENYTGIDLPVSKIDHVLIPNHSSRSTGNWGLIVYDDDEIMFTEDPSDTYNLETTAKLVTNNLVQQWFGNLVGPTCWDNSWLNEAFAHYFQYYIVDKIFEDWRVLDLFVVVVQQASAFSEDSYSFTRYNKINKGIYGEARYNLRAITSHKGTCLLRMLSRCLLTEDEFHAGVVKYLERFRYNTATADDLWKIFEETMDPDRVNPKEMMDSWIKQSGYPVLTATRDYKTGVITVTQKRFEEPNSDDEEDDERDDDDARWWIPVNYTCETQRNFTTTLTKNWLRPRDSELIINDVDRNDWFIINLQQTGYYRVNYDPTNWKRIAGYLDSSNYTKIHPLNRAQIIDDSCYMVITKRLDPTVFLEIVKYLRRETDYIPWYPAFRALRTFQDFLSFPKSEILLKPYIFKLIDGLLRNVGYDECTNDDHLTKLKRADVLHLASDLGHTECKKIANTKLIAHMENPELNPVPTNLNNWLFTTGMRYADESLFNKFLDIYKTNPSFGTLRYLSSIEDPNLIKLLLELTLADDSPFLRADRVEIYRSLIYTSSMNVDITVDFVIDHWEQITARIEEADEIIDDIVGEITSWNQFHKVKSFMEENGLKGKRNIEDSRTFLENAERYTPEIVKWLETEMYNDTVARFENL